MFTIGDFARYGRVSPRMLRHYDAIGLLRPDRTDPATGYRFYGAAQLARLNRIIALKDLGFTLQQVGAVLDEQVGPEELRGMLRLRRAELAEAVAAATARLAQVEARLRSIESEGHMPADDVVIKTVPAVRVAELTGTAASYEPHHIGPVIGPLYEEPPPAPGGCRPAAHRARDRPVRGRPRGWRRDRRARGGDGDGPGGPGRRDRGERGGAAPVRGGDGRAPGRDGRRAADRADPGPLAGRERLPLHGVHP